MPATFSTFTFVVPSTVGAAGAGVAAAGVSAFKRTFSLHGAPLNGDQILVQGSTDGGATYQDLVVGAGTPESSSLVLSYTRPEAVIDDACTHYRMVRKQNGLGSVPITSAGLVGEIVAAGQAWVQGGNAWGALGVLGTTDAFGLSIIAENKQVFLSDGIDSGLGNTDASVPGNSLTMLAGSGGYQVVTDNGGAVDIESDGAMTLGTNATNPSTTLGSILSTNSPTVINSGRSGVSIQPAATGPVTVTSGTSGLASLDSGSTGPVFVGAGAAVKSCTFGSITGASATALRAGSGGLTLVRGAVTWTWPAADATLANARAALISDGAGGLTFGNSIQSGTTSLSSGVSAAIPANIAAGSQIFIQATDTTPGAGNLTIGYRPLVADRVNGTPGSFKVTAVLAAGTINILDTSAGIRWMVLNP